MDIVRPSSKQCQAVYEKGFRLWSSLYIRATQESCLPQACFEIQDILQEQPRFPVDLDLKNRHSHLYATGTSIWETSQSSCKLPLVEKHIDIAVTKVNSTRLTLSPDSILSNNWFSTEENHLSVLIPAWAYILSARWTDLMPGSTALKYTNSQASWNDTGTTDRDAIIINIGDVNGDAARWWAAVLAPGEGWQAEITSGEDKFRSPWSITFETDTPIVISRNKTYPPSSNAPASFEAGIRFLSDYCILHNIMDQSNAALSAALFLPSLPQAILPRPRLNHDVGINPTMSKPTTQSTRSWIQNKDHLDKLLTLSCHTWGLWSLLSSVLYEPDIACNVVNPWLQSIFAVLDSVTDDRVLVHILMSRVPHLAPLWLGGIIMGIQKKLFTESQFGLIPIDLHSAMWSGTLQSFIQEHVAHHSVVDSSILRSDECRLLFLTQGEYHTRWPICQWAPFGSTALEHTELDVRLHTKCCGHGLRYQGFKWICINGKIVYQKCNNPLIPVRVPTQQAASNIPINYDGLNIEENASENATRMIFSWLRFEGYPPQERDIYNHEWFDVGDSDDEKSLDNGSEKGSVPPSSGANVETWVGDVH